jgi:hypothetical protein
MNLTSAQRIAAIKESATLLSQQEWGEIDLILEQHGLSVADSWQGSDRYAYVIKMIKDASDERLHELHHYLIGEPGEVPTGVQPWGQGNVKLFMSHLAAHQKFVESVGAHLSLYGVSCFVAHVSIEPSEEWYEVIETALRSCDAMAAFLHPGFHESNWCDQELGFAMARRVPILPISIGVLPYGFMGKLQAARCGPDETNWKVAEKVIQWLIRVPSTQTALAEGLVTAFERASSYSDTRWIYGALSGMPAFTPIQLKRLEAATKDNSQVRDAVLGPNRIPDLIRKLVERGGTLASS